MLNSSEFSAYCKKCALSKSAVDYIQLTRSSEPSRRVGDNARGNVCGRIPMPSINLTVQTESRSCKAIFVYQCQLSQNVLEVWDQPPQIQLRRDKGKLGTHVASYTPDFLVLYADRATLVECKPRDSLDKLLTTRPEDWSYREQVPQFLPAVESARVMGLSHETFVAEDWAPIYLANLEFLRVLHLNGPVVGKDTQLNKVIEKITKKQLTIIELCDQVRGLTPEVIYRWISNSELYGGLKSQLLSQQDIFRIFCDEVAAITFQTELLDARRMTPTALDDSDLAAILRATPQELNHATRLREKFDEVIRGERKPTRNEYRYMARIEEASATKSHPVSAFLPKFSAQGNRSPASPRIRYG